LLKTQTVSRKYRTDVQINIVDGYLDITGIIEDLLWVGYKPLLCSMDFDR